MNVVLKEIEIGCSKDNAILPYRTCVELIMLRIQKVVEAVAKADLVTITAIGPNIYHSLRNFIPKGIEQRRVSGNTTQLMF